MNAALSTLTSAPPILSVCDENEEVQLKESLGA